MLSTCSATAVPVLYAYPLVIVSIPITALAIDGIVAIGNEIAIVLIKLEWDEVGLFSVEVEEIAFTFDNSDTAIHTWLDLHQITLNILFM